MYVHAPIYNLKHCCAFHLLIFSLLSKDRFFFISDSHSSSLLLSNPFFARFRPLEQLVTAADLPDIYVKAKVLLAQVDREHADIFARESASSHSTATTGTGTGTNTGESSSSTSQSNAPSKTPLVTEVNTKVYLKAFIAFTQISTSDLFYLVCLFQLQSAQMPPCVILFHLTNTYVCFKLRTGMAANTRV